MDLTRAIIVLAVIVGSVILHELAHGIVAYWLGDKTAKEAGRLTLNPFKHIDPVMSILVPMVLYLLNAPVFGGAKPVPVDFSRLKWRAFGMALVAFAGPFTNFLIALVTFLIGYFTGVFSGPLGGHGPVLLQFAVAEIITINIGFMIFNLIPIPPLDGSRILYAISPDAVRRFLDQIESFGFILVYALILFFGQVFTGVMTGGMQAVLNFFYFLVGK